jgi:hypothetical protein
MSLISIVKITNQEWKEHNKETDSIPEKECVPWIVIWSDSAIDCTGSQHLNNFI